MSFGKNTGTSALYLSGEEINIENKKGKNTTFLWHLDRTFHNVLIIGCNARLHCLQF